MIYKDVRCTNKIKEKKSYFVTFLGDGRTKKIDVTSKKP